MERLEQAARVCAIPIFQEECDYAIKQMYTECLEAISAHDYPKADSLNTTIGMLKAFLERFKLMALLYKEEAVGK